MGLAVKVPVVGVAFLVGLGPYSAGWAISHADDVAKALGEFGGTSATHVTLFPHHCVRYISTPVDEGDNLSATAIHVRAKDSCTGEIIVDQVVPNRTLH